MAYSSKLIEQAITEVAKLPGIGKKSALRIVLHLLRQETIETSLLTSHLQNLRENIKYSLSVLIFLITIYVQSVAAISEMKH